VQPVVELVADDIVASTRKQQRVKGNQSALPLLETLFDLVALGK